MTVRYPPLPEGAARNNAERDQWLDRLMADKRLSDGDKVVAFVLSRYWNAQSGWAFPSVPTIARDSGKSDRYVYEHLRRLTDTTAAHLHRVTPRIGGKCYTALVTPDVFDRGSNPVPVVPGTAQPLSKTSTDPCRKHVQTPVEKRHPNSLNSVKRGGADGSRSLALAEPTRAEVPKPTMAELAVVGHDKGRADALAGEDRKSAQQRFYIRNGQQEVRDAYDAGFAAAIGPANQSRPEKDSAA